MKTTHIAALLVLLGWSGLNAQTISRFNFDDPGFDERIATVGPNAISSGSLSNARATGNGTPQGCAAGYNPFGSGGCFTGTGCPQTINMTVPNTGNIFNVASPTMSIDYRRPIREIDGWFWLKDQLAFGVRFSKMTARYSHDNGSGGCIPQVEFAAYPPAWNWSSNGLWTWGGAAASNGEIPPDGVWRTYGFTYDASTGVASITVNNPAHTEYSFGVAGMSFCGWTTANMAMFNNMDNSATGITPNTTAFLDNASYGLLTPLPVTLEYFRGEQNGLGVDLTWKTTEETQNLGFILYRSTDGASWVEFARVDGNGTTQSENAYSYRDETPHKGLNFYRLVQIDMNGATAGYPAVRVNMQFAGQDLLALFPNPVTEGQLHLKYESDADGTPLVVQVLDLNGKLVHKDQFSLVSGLNELDLNLEGLATGMYIAKVSDGRRSYSEKFSLIAGR